MPVSQTGLTPDAFTRFGELLRFLRHRARLTQRELSIAVGYNFAHLSRLEHGARLPDPTIVAAVFVPALDLAEDPAWAARLVALAESAHQQAAASTVTHDAPQVDRREAPARSAAVPPSVPELRPLLTTKLFVPRVRPDALARPRLLTQLDRALSVPLTLVAAPPGWGKTTLLAEWLHRQRPEARDWRLAESSLASSPQPLASRLAWLSLDAGDNELATFVRYLVVACQRLAPEIGKTTLTLIQQPALLPPATLLVPLVNDLAALPQTGVLVLDDVHTLTAAVVHSALAFLVEHLPPQLHLILASREDPPLPLPRLRARGQLVELGARELRFTGDESALFLRDTMKVPLTDADAALLQARTEGWAAGLQLAALALHDRVDPADFVAALSGSQRYLGDYLAGEVLERLPAHLKSFVLQTSILERMCGELCDVVLGVGSRAIGDGRAADSSSSQLQTPSPQAYSQLILAELERRQLFVVPLDDERRWYRYHHLFAELLRARLQQGISAEAMAALHRRASTWYEAQGLVLETVQHALAGQDWERAARLIEEHGLRLMLRGQLHTGLGWLNALPAAVFQMHSLLCIVHAIGLMLTNRADMAEARLKDAERALEPDAPDELVRVVRGSVAGVRGRMLYLAGDLAQAIGSLQQAMALLPETTTSTAAGVTSAMARTAWAVYMATDYQVTGDVTEASERRAAEAIAPVRALGHMMATLNGYTSLADLQVLQGRLHTAVATYAEVEPLVHGPDAPHALVGSPAYYFGLGELWREWNDLDAADGYLALGMELVRGTLATEAVVIMRGYLALARLQQARGHGAAALATLEAFMVLARERQFFHLLIEHAAALRARLQLMQGDLAAAVSWAEASGLFPDDEPYFPREAAYLTLARVRIAAGQAAAVVPLLDRLLADAEAKARLHSAIGIRVLQALAYDALDARPHALAALERALTLAEPEGFVRIFVDQGAPMAALLRRLPATSERMLAYTEQLLAAFPQP
jgi:LuxR family maltose regulon positive regulatory protein